MGMPTDIGVVDLCIQAPEVHRNEGYKFLESQLRDEGSKELAMPAGYMFKDVPEDADESLDPVEVLLAEMDRHGIEMGVLGIKEERPETMKKILARPDRLLPMVSVDPNDVMGSVRKVEAYVREHGAVSANFFPAGCNPQVDIDDEKVYPVYAKCVELGVPIMVCAGVPGPRVPMDCQKVERIDRVCYDFPELRFVIRHGAMPWTELAVKLMLKWPNLYYCTSAMAPKHYPPDIVHYANTRGADKIMYAGYYPMGLSLERIFAELPDVPFRDHVWPLFLRENAVRVFRLDERRGAPTEES